jgi:hypothetical protein
MVTLRSEVYVASIYNFLVKEWAKATKGRHKAALLNKKVI